MQMIIFTLLFLGIASVVLIASSYSNALKSNTLTLMSLSVFAGALVLNTPAPQLSTILSVSLFGYLGALVLKKAISTFDVSNLKHYQEPLILLSITLLVYVLLFWVPALEMLHQAPMAWWHAVLGLSLFAMYYSFERFIKHR